MTAESGAIGESAKAPSLDAIPSNPLRALVSPQLWLASLHLVTDVVAGTITFTAAITMLSLSCLLMFAFFLGIPVWILTAWMAAGMASFERTRFAFFLGVDIPAPPWPVRPPDVSWLRYAGLLVRAGTVWRQLAYHLLLLPIGALNIVLVTAAWAVPLFLLSLPFSYDKLAAHHANLGLFTVSNGWTAAVGALLGLAVLLLITPHLIRGLAAMDIAIGRGLLGRWSTGELTERVGELEVTRRRAVDAAEAERRRIERDLHDGAQQRLTSLAMTLGRVQLKMRDSEDLAVRDLIDDAHRDAKEAIVELRDLTRGLHPPVLTDRGLDAALSALAARAPVPVAVSADVGERPSRTIEAIAYFVVAEALTNIAKHAQATCASVVVRRLDSRLRIDVTDDGRGGAALSPDGGLAGLTDRVRAVDGRLVISSPLGGPTVLTVELPCR